MELLQPPRSEESERAVLGSILINADAFGYAAQYIQSHEDFFLLRHGLIWQAMERILERSEALDPILIADELQAMGRLEDVGGRAYLIDLSNSVGTSIHASAYADMVARMAERRQWLRAADTISRQALALDIPVHEARKNADSAWLQALGGAELKRGIWAKELASETYEDFERALYDDPHQAISTGIKDLDDLIIGHEPSQLSVYAGRPGMGKSTSFLTMALHACRAGEVVPIFSSEMSKKQIMNRLLAMIARVPVKKIKQPKLLERHEAARVTNAFAEIAEFRLFIDDTPKPSPRHIRAISKLLVQKQGAKVVFVDGIYLMQPNHRSNNQVDNIGSIVDDLREIARSLEIHVAATHQLNRDVEKRQNKRPTLADLRDSGVVEQTADKVIFLYRDDVYNGSSEHPNQIDFIVAKHRDGNTGTASAYFDGEHVSILNGKLKHIDLYERVRSNGAIHEEDNYAE